MTMKPTHHLDPRKTADERTSLLLEQMTLREKCYQLTSVPPWYFVQPDLSAPAVRTQWLEKAPGHISNFGIDDPRAFANIVAEMQRVVVGETRLGIPLLIHSEALSGFMSGGHMVFPTAIGLAATWSPELVQDMAKVISRQMRRLGSRQALSPNMDVAVDPRWGRVHETYGEDPYLVAANSVAYTRGLQGNDLSEGVIATSKHFVGYSKPEAGINLSAYEGGRRLTRDLFAYPFEAAIQLAGLASVMNSYADLDSSPVGASREVLTQLLRDTLGFTGFVSADYMTLEHMVNRQRAASNAAEAGRLAITAGLDVENPIPFGYGDTLAAEVERGAVDVSFVDTSVRRILTAKFTLGLFENPYPQERIDLPEITAEGRDLSYELARRSVVLLKNDDGLLPLKAGAHSIAVIGPHADALKLQFPTYTYPAFREMTRFMSGGGMGNMVGVDPGMAAWNNALLPETTTEDYVRETFGATTLAEEIAQRATSSTSHQGSNLTHDLDERELERAQAAAAEADIVVLALGGASLWFNGERTEGEGSDSADIELPAAQRRLAEAVVAQGKPVVVVLFQGRAYALPDAVRDSAAVIVAPYGGPYGPASVAEAIFGEVNPSGKLPYSIPRHSGQLPIHHHQRWGSGHRNPLPPDVDTLYLDMDATPQYTFGEGKSYTSFQLSSLHADDVVPSDGEWVVATTIRNTGSRSGAATPQLYLSLAGFGVTRPSQQLAGFTRVELQPGEAKRITIRVSAAQLGYTALDRRFVVEPGPVEFFIGLDSADRRQSGRFTITGERRELASHDRAFLSDVDVTEA